MNRGLKVSRSTALCLHHAVSNCRDAGTERCHDGIWCLNLVPLLGPFKTVMNSGILWVYGMCTVYIGITRCRTYLPQDFRYSNNCAETSRISAHRKCVRPPSEPASRVPKQLTTLFGFFLDGNPFNGHGNPIEQFIERWLLPLSGFSVVQCTNSPSHIFWLTGQLQWLMLLPFKFDLCNFQVLTCQPFLLPASCKIMPKIKNASGVGRSPSTRRTVLHLKPCHCHEILWTQEWQHDLNSMLTHKLPGWTKTNCKWTIHASHVPKCQPQIGGLPLTQFCLT